MRPANLKIGAGIIIEGLSEEEEKETIGPVGRTKEAGTMNAMTPRRAEEPPLTLSGLLLPWASSRGGPLLLSVLSAGRGENSGPGHQGRGFYCTNVN